MSNGSPQADPTGLSRQAARAGVGAVFFVSVAMAVIFVLWGALFTANLSAVFSTFLDYLIGRLGFLYTLLLTGFLLFLAYLAIGPYSKVRLGADAERPEFGRVSWFTMLFSAGIGLSFLFWGVAEPASHFGSTPYGLTEAGTQTAASLSMQYTFFHWGLHAWATYGLVGLILAYFGFRKGTGSLVSSAFRPLIGDQANGIPGKIVDVLAIFAVLFGVATALGIGAQQLGGGISFVFGIANEFPLQLTIIVIFTVIFLFSAASGIKRGIRYLSWTNMVLAAFLMVFVLLAGPTLYIFSTLFSGTGNYIVGLVPMTVRGSGPDQGTWAQTWTLFYWAWWVSWAPFVGAFIARISRGRTIRDFIVGVVVIPTAMSFVWFSIFGATGLDLDLAGQVNVSQIAGADLPRSLFETLSALPLGGFVAIIALILVSVFFVTSADSATFVLSSMSTNGQLEPAWPVKLTWGLMIAAFAGVLLFVGGLTALQTATIAAAAPFAIIMIGMCVGLYKSLREERRAGEKAQGNSEEALERTQEPTRTTPY